MDPAVQVARKKILLEKLENVLDTAGTHASPTRPIESLRTLSEYSRLQGLLVTN